MEDFIFIVWPLIITLLVLLLIALCGYAKRLGQGIGVTIFMGIFLTPLFTFFYLYLLGETDEHRKARILEEEKWKRDALENKTTENEESSDKKVTDILNL